MPQAESETHRSRGVMLAAHHRILRVFLAEIIGWAPAHRMEWILLMNHTAGLSPPYGPGSRIFAPSRKRLATCLLQTDGLAGGVRPQARRLLGVVILAIVEALCDDRVLRVLLSGLHYNFHLIVGFSLTVQVVCFTASELLVARSKAGTPDI